MNNEYIIATENFLSDDKMAKLLSQMKVIPLKEAMVSDGDEPRVDYEYRICRNCKVPLDDPDYKWIYDLITENIRQYNDALWKFPIDESLTEVEYVEYDAENGSHFEWHTDSLDMGPKSKRRISVVIQLSEAENYKGGELQMRKHDGNVITLPKSKGRTFLFASESAEHRVTAVTEGKRISLVAWASV